MAIPNLTHLIYPLCDRFPSAWAKACAPHDDGEFNAKVCSVLHYEHGYEEVGRNGKRGNPNDLSKDVICWQGEGQNYDPTDGNKPVQIIDFIGGHESASASIVWSYTDPSGPGAWVQPEPLADTGGGGGGGGGGITVNCQYQPTNLDPVLAAIAELRTVMEQQFANNNTEIISCKDMSNQALAVTKNLSDRFEVGMPILEGKVGLNELSGKVKG